MDKEFIVKNISKDQFTPFNVTDEELLSFAIDEASLMTESTQINGVSAKELAKSFYSKRDKFRQNTRLGHILINDFGVTKEDLLRALVYHEEKQLPLGEAFVELNICTSEQINSALIKQTEMRSYFRE